MNLHVCQKIHICELLCKLKIKAHRLPSARTPLYCCCHVAQLDHLLPRGKDFLRHDQLFRKDPWLCTLHHRFRRGRTKLQTHAPLTAVQLAAQQVHVPQGCRCAAQHEQQRRAVIRPCRVLPADQRNQTHEDIYGRLQQVSSMLTAA